MKNKLIDIKFNVLLLVFLGIYYVFGAFFEPELEKNTLWDTMFVNNVPLGIAIALVVSFTLLCIGSYFLREIWNRFFSDVFTIRSIDFSEALALVLLITIFFS